MALLEYYDYTKYFIYTDILKSSLYFIFEIFVAFFVVALVESNKKNVNVNDHKFEILGRRL